MRKCLECEKELENDNAIIAHTCEAYPRISNDVWLDNLLEKGER